MSWTIFTNKCNTALGGGTMDRTYFVKKLLTEYHECIQRHKDVINGGGQFSNLSPKPIITILNIWTQLNQMSPPGTVANVNLLDQLKFVIPIYFIGGVSNGPLGISTILFPGLWLPVELKQNLNMMIMLNKISLLGILHTKTLLGTFVSSSTGLITPWSGVSLMTAG